MVLILVGYYVRRKVEESPVFTELAARKEKARMPLAQLFRKHLLLVIIAAFVFDGNNAVGYMTTGGYIQGYVTNPEGQIGLERGPVLWAVAGSAVTWLLATLLACWLSDRIDRRTTYLIGWALQLVSVFTLFPLVNTGEIGLLFAGLAILTISRVHVRPAGGPLRGAVPREHPVLGRLDLVRNRCYRRWGLRADDRSGIPLGPDHEEEQSVSPIYGLSKA